ncbi:hypothetical protein N8003_01585 [Candidatus Pelagibacter ubique]|jgi:uncharacterized membrane protein YgaE (UPF0421/DUF939 family)|nr:hypothetical protein [Candidatus Pelagibacter ubique]
MVKRNIPDWQRSAFDKDNNSCVKTKPFGKRIKELEVAYAKVEETKAKVEDIDVSILSLKEEPVKEEKDDKLDELKEYQKMRDRQRKEEQEKSKRDENKVVFTSAPRQDPNRGMRFVRCTEPINKGKLGSSKSFIKKKDKEYY